MGNAYNQVDLEFRLSIIDNDTMKLEQYNSKGERVDIRMIKITKHTKRKMLLKRFKEKRKKK